MHLIVWFMWKQHFNFFILIRSVKVFLYGREPWSNGYGRRLMFQRSWVRIPGAVYWMDMTFFTLICCKNCSGHILFNLTSLFEKTKNKWKRGQGWHILKKEVFFHYLTSQKRYFENTFDLADRYFVI